MAEKITAMAESTSLADGDLITVVDDPAGTPDNVKVTLATLKAFVASTGGGGSGAFQFLASATSTGAGSSLSSTFGALSTGILSLRVELSKVTIGTQDQLLLQYQTSTGWVVSGYAYQCEAISVSGSENNDGSNSAAGWVVTDDGATWGLPASEPYHGTMEILGNVSVSGQKAMLGQGFYEAGSGNHLKVTFGGDSGANTGAIRGVRATHEGGGNITGGQITVHTIAGS